LIRRSAINRPAGSARLFDPRARRVVGKMHCACCQRVDRVPDMQAVVDQVVQVVAEVLSVDACALVLAVG
jgi:hypothetical protein